MIFTVNFLQLSVRRSPLGKQKTNRATEMSIHRVFISSLFMEPVKRNILHFPWSPSLPLFLRNLT